MRPFCLEKFGPPQLRFAVAGGPVQLHDDSPTDLETFKGMSTDALVTYLIEWTPPASLHPVRLPSRAGMAQTLRDWVSDNPQHASEVLDAFLSTKLDPAYITAMLDAFSAALKSEEAFDVYGVARAAQWVAENTDALTGSPADGQFNEATWNWAHMSAARYMSDLLLLENRLDIGRAGELFPVVRSLCFLPHPTEGEEAEYKKEASRHVSYALNTPRPVGIEAMIRYARWIKLATPRGQFTPAMLAPALQVLEQKLDPETEPSAAVREMFGMQFRILAWLNLNWFMSIIPKLFPGRDGKLRGERTLDRFGWSAYLQYGGPVSNTLPAMRKRYLQAVRSLQKGDEQVGDLDRTLASHLMQYYAHGDIELDDPLLTTFFESASVALRGQAIGDIGWNLRDAEPLSPNVQERLMQLWESRTFLLGEHSRAEADELAGFGWWLASGKFPDEWAVDKAMAVLEFLRRLRPDFAVVETMGRLSVRFPYEAVKVVRVLFEEDREGWAIHGWSQYLDNILERALSDGEVARKEASEMIDLLVSRGFREYRRYRRTRGANV